MAVLSRRAWQEGRTCPPVSYEQTEKILAMLDNDASLEI